MDEFKKTVLNSISVSKKVHNVYSHNLSFEHDYDLLTNGPFFPSNLKTSFDKAIFEERTSFKMKATLVNLIIKSKSNHSYTQFFTDYITLCVGILEDVFKKSIPEFTVILALLNKPRSTFSRSDKHLSSEHVNSGFTIKYPDRSPLIFVYRQNEMCKVILHELLHAYQIHPCHYPKIYDKELIKKYKINLRNVETLNIFESYVEFIAILINSIVYDHKFKTKNALEKETVQQIETAKQLKMYKPYSESTNVFAYVFLKTNLINHMDRILNETKTLHYCIEDIRIIMPEKRMVLKKTKKKTFSSRITLNVMDIFKTYLKLVHSKNITI